MAGAVLYEGPSQLNGAPVVALVTGFDEPSRNGKTGAVLQAWILSAETHPLDAQGGADAAVCGDCIHRQGSCYVNLAWAPANIWKAWRRGVTRPLEAPTGRVVRLGAYGDPVAIPFDAWMSWLAPAKGWLGYTHQWRTAAAAPFRALCMASVDTPEEAHEARAAGWRTFRVRAAGAPLVPGVEGRREVMCPASEEAGHRTTCEKCRLCDGGGRAKGPHVVIEAHGALANRWTQPRLIEGRRPRAQGRREAGRYLAVPEGPPAQLLFPSGGRIP